MNASPLLPSDAELLSRLCLSCGLCCNGVLFSSVLLQPSDETDALLKAGIQLAANTNPKEFSQPCCALQGTACSVYAHRPQRCRSFTCRLFDAVAADSTSIGQAQKQIHTAQASVVAIRRMLRELGNHDEAVALSRRCQPYLEPAYTANASEETISLIAELQLAVQQLQQQLHTQFYSMEATR